ncbi:hypothetical protein KCP75_24980 [Salmonella enterica subsp. enterica]|nr:hypothetical protein KCP75_24980 [Salmonella enterica subsp. enterica]
MARFVSFALTGEIVCAPLALKLMCWIASPHRQIKPEEARASGWRYRRSARAPSTSGAPPPPTGESRLALGAPIVTAQRFKPRRAYSLPDDAYAGSPDALWGVSSACNHGAHRLRCGCGNGRNYALRAHLALRCIWNSRVEAFRADGETRRRWLPIARRVDHMRTRAAFPKPRGCWHGGNRSRQRRGPALPPATRGAALAAARALAMLTNSLSHHAAAVL